MHFTQLTPLSYPIYRPYFENQRYALCAYSLSSIIAWTNDEFKPFGAFNKDALIVAAEFDNVKSNRHLLLPISPRRMVPPDELAAVARMAGHTQYWFVPKAYLEQYGDDAVGRYFTVHRQAAYDDYIYRVDDLVHLSGNRFSKKRNLIKQFQRDYVDRGKVAIDAISSDNVPECLDFLEQWCLERDCDGDEQVDLACEKQAAINALNHYDDFDLKGLLLRIDGAVSAFGIAAPLTRDMGILQYEKAFSSIKGLYQYFDNACARRLFNGYAYINKESDMGIPGLAKAKKSYFPVTIVRAYRLVLRT